MRTTRQAMAMDQKKLEEAKKKAMQIINARAMSKGEMTDRLEEKGIEPEYASAAADWLEELGAIDDRVYAAMLTRHCASKGYGEARVKNELYRRRIDPQLWDEALLQMPETDEAVDRFIYMKLKGERPDRRELKRVSDALVRRGYSWDEISSGLRRYEETLEEDFC